MRGVHYIIRLAMPLNVAQAEFLEAIPGVRAKKLGMEGILPRVLCPLHAGFLVEAALQRWGGAAGEHYLFEIDAKIPHGVEVDALGVPPEDSPELQRGAAGEDPADAS